MSENPTYEELVQRVSDLEAEVSKREQSEEARRENEGLYESLVENISLGVILIDPDYKVVMVNSAQSRISNKPIDRIVGGKCYRVFENRDDICPHCPGVRAMATGEPAEAETGAILEDGSRYSVRVQAFPTYGDDGKIKGFIEVVEDITDRVQMEEALTETEIKYRVLFEECPDGILITDVEKKKHRYANPAICEMLGYSKNELSELGVDDIHPKNSLDFVISEFNAHSKGEKAYTKSIPCLRKDGTIFDADINACTTVIDGITYNIGFFRDVTERKRIEEMLIQSEKMISIGGLAAGMAHEINNPLAGILQNIQLIHNRILRDLPKNRRTAKESGTKFEAIKGYIERRGLLPAFEAIMESGKRAAQIVDDMLSFSRRGELKKVPCDIRKLLDKTVDLASKDFDLIKMHDFRKIKVTRDYQDPMPHVPCEAGQIQQVFLNILKNGAQALSEGNDKIETPRFTLRVMTDEGMARIEIEDNGTGIDEATRRRIFEPFFTTKENEGTGLGLSVSYFIIVDNHGGTISVESNLGHGTKFILRLPLKKEEKESPEF